MEEKENLSRTAFRKLATVLAILLIVCVGMAASPHFIPEVEAARTRVFTEEGNSYSTSWWTTYTGTPTAESGYLKIHQASCHGAVYVKYANFTFRAKVTVFPPGGWEALIALLTNYTDPTSITNSIFISFNSDHTLSAQCRKQGSESYTTVGTYGIGSWQNIKIIWDSSVVKFYVNGTSKWNCTTAASIIQSRAKLYLRALAAEYDFDVDYVYLEEDRPVTYVTPHISYANITAWLNPSWTEGNKTLWASMTGSGTYIYKVYVPSTYLQYFAEVKKNGVVTTNIAFDMAARELSVKGITGTIVAVQLVDPPQILVNLYYWLLGFGISIAPLLKVWDKLASIHKLLPYVLIVVAAACLIVAAWSLWTYWTYWRFS